MKKIILAIACLSAMYTGKAFAITPYIQGNISVIQNQDATGRTASGGSVTHENIEYDPTIGVSAALGLRLHYNFRVDAEIGYSKSDVDNVDGIANDNQLTEKSLFANAYYDYHINDDFAVYVGGGIGVINVDYSSTGDDSTTGYKAALGGYYYITNNLEVTAGYSHIAADDLEHKLGTSNLTLEHASDRLNFGIRYSF